VTYSGLRPDKRAGVAATTRPMTHDEGTAMSNRNRTRRVGIEERRDRSGQTRYRGYITVDSASGRKLRGEWTPSLAEAKNWRVQALANQQAGILAAKDGLTVREAALAWIDLADAGQARNRSGDPFKPSVLRDYRSMLERRIIPALGASRLHEVTSADIQRLADRLTLEGLSPSGVRNALMPLRALYRWHAARDGIPNPTKGVQLPAVRSRRPRRIVAPATAAQMIAALPQSERAAWGCAFYAGMRLCEIRALRWDHVNLAEGLIRVQDGWDQREGPIKPKSRKGERRVPIASLLRELLIEHGLDTRRERGLVFGRTEDQPFTLTTMRDRALKAWKDAGLEALTTHEARHTFASLMIAAGVNAKQLSEYMGHESIATTYDIYGHLLPGNEVEAAGLLDAYLDGFSD
jgi:integrase